MTMGELALSAAITDVGDTPVMTVLGTLAVILLVAKALGEISERMGQPAVVGELLAGVLLGPSLINLVDPSQAVVHVLAEAGVIVLLFSIGLETDLKRLLQVGGTSASVALAGVVLPFAGGYFVSMALGLTALESTVMGAALTATSVGITARVLSDLGQLSRPEGQVILGAAVIDDVIGLIILAIVADAVAGASVTPSTVVRATLLAFGFVAASLIIGGPIMRKLLDQLSRITDADVLATTALAIAFLFALLAQSAGSAPIIGAFAAGLLIARTPQAHPIEKGIRGVGNFFVPVFFVAVGAGVDVRTFAEPMTLLIGGSLLVVGIVGKVLAGYAAWWFKGNKLAIGIGMVPRGEVGLIFAQVGLAAGVLNARRFSALAFVVLVTTLMAPPLLKRLFPKQEDGDPEFSAVQELVSEA